MSHPKNNHFTINSLSEDSSKDPYRISPQAYRDAMSHFAHAVHIVTTDGPAGLRGATISACCSVSDSPPTLLICLMKHQEGNQIFIENGCFCVNILAHKHKNLADLFAGRLGFAQSERFAQHSTEISWTSMATGSPVLEGALAAFDCQLESWHEHKTHYVLYGRVVHICSFDSGSALLYWKRKYYQTTMIPLPDSSLPASSESLKTLTLETVTPQEKSA